MKKILTIFILLLFSLPVFSYEDCIISTDGKLTDIKIQHNDIIDVFPLITIMNDKNTLIVHPLKTGNTKFSVLKNKSEKILFNVSVSEEKTIVDEVAGFDILTVDCPPGDYEYDIEIDEPPAFGIFELDKPPLLRGE